MGRERGKGMEPIRDYDSMSLESLLKLRRSSSTYAKSKKLAKVIKERIESGIRSDAIPKHKNPAKGKWIPAKAIKFLGNGKVQVKV